MKLSLNLESASALRELADSFPGVIANIANDTLKLVVVYQSVSDTLGSHRNDFHQMLLHIKKAQILSTEALEILPPMMRATADKIERYIALHPSDSGTAITLTSRATVSIEGDGSISYRDARSFQMLSGHDILEKFGVVQCKNGTDVFVKGDYFARFEEIYNASDEYPSQPCDCYIELNVSPNLIEGIHLGKMEAKNPELFWQQHKNGGTAESFQEIASYIPEVQNRLASGAALSELEEDPRLTDCIGIYFRNMPEVLKCDGYYEFVGNGRHRILAARALGYDIPVKVIGERRRKNP